MNNIEIRNDVFCFLSQLVLVPRFFGGLCSLFCVVRNLRVETRRDLWHLFLRMASVSEQP